MPLPESLTLRLRGGTAAVSQEVAMTWQLAVLPAGAARTPAALAEIAPEWLSAAVPGTAVAALFDAGRADFEHLPRLDDEDVWYRARFAASTVATRRLRLEGLATLAEVWLNGGQILESSNMFLAHAVEVGPRLKEQNELLIRFASVQAALKVRRPRPRWRTRLVEQQQLRWIRASLLGRIPGWTPAVPAIGPWRPVELEPADALLRVTACDARAHLDADAGQLSMSLALDATRPDVQIRAASLHVGEARTGLAVQFLDGRWQLDGALRIEAVRRWWPHTHGEPALYAVSVTVETTAGMLTLDCGNTGFRQVELASADDGFAVAINGAPVFCRGACWTTTDILRLGGAQEATREALLLARDAGMNMLRIGGTMVYESDVFYALCDELGILVWQDWMFANMDYPADDADFVGSVTAEARQFLQRTQLSPSLALLCGNSEIEQQAAMLGLEQPLWRNRLFAELLPQLGATLRPDVPYWPSSPAGGVLPFQVDAGAAHYFGVGAYLQPLTDARRSGVRFTSECLAFANVPEPETIEALLGDGESPLHHPRWKARVPRDSGPGWDFDDVRDHYLAELFQVDPMRLRYADMDRYLALSRVVSGEVMAATFAEWRRHGSSCAGGLVWFFRDLWRGAGWGLVDADGIPKAAWHYLKRAMAPVALFMTNEGVNGLALHAVNDGAEPIAARLNLALYRDGEAPVAQGGREIVVPARGGLMLRGDALFGHFLDTTYTYRFGPAGHTLAYATLHDAQGNVLLGSDFFFPLGHAFAVQASIGLSAEVQATEDGYAVTVRSSGFAQAVSLDVPGHLASHNYFHLAPGGTQTVQLRPRRAGTRLNGKLQALNSLQRIKIAPPS